MTLEERAASYRRAFPKFPPVHVTDRWLYGVWTLGNDYRGTGYYGSYPPSFLRRVWSLFPDVDGRVLHLCSGSLPRGTRGVRLDYWTALEPDVAGDAHALPFVGAAFQVVIVDPPYGGDHAARYHLPMVNRRRVVREA